MSVLSAESLTLGARLRDVLATLQPGTITAICGPNGAGKSTLLHMLAGLLAPDAGVVRIGAVSLPDLNPRDRARRIGFLPQDAEVAWDVSVANLVALGRLPHGDRDGAAIERALAATDLLDFAARPVSTLSGGERARALLARVLAGEPEWILADEPLAALDLGHQLRLMRHLRACADRRAGVVVVLHDLPLAINHADRVLVLDDGELVADGPPREALSAEIIAQVWHVAATWMRHGDTHALSIEPLADD